jgi:hypothetical protein
MNIRNRRIPRARIRRHHHVAFLIRENDLPCDIAFDNLMIEIPTHRVATDGVDFKALCKGKACLQINPRLILGRKLGIKSASSIFGFALSLLTHVEC